MEVEIISGGKAKMNFMSCVVLSNIFQILGFSPFSTHPPLLPPPTLHERGGREGNILAYRALLGKPTSQTHPDAAAAVAKVKEGTKEGDIIYDICPRFGVRLRLSRALDSTRATTAAAMLAEQMWTRGCVCVSTSQFRPNVRTHPIRETISYTMFSSCLPQVARLFKRTFVIGSDCRLLKTYILSPF